MFNALKHHLQGALCFKNTFKTLKITQHSFMLSTKTLSSRPVWRDDNVLVLKF
jgi:hypothetical protein